MSNFEGALLKRIQGRIALALLLGIVLLGIFTGTAYSQEESANQKQNPEPILPANGYDLLNLMTFRAGMKLVTSFEELENSSTGMLILLGNQNSRVNWPSIDRWVRRGGALLVAFDDTPPRTLQASIGEITGYQWANIRLLHFGESGVDQLPQHSFAEIQKIVPFDWHLWPKPGTNSPNEKPANGKGHSNSPSFLFPLESNFPKAAVFATFTTDVRLDIANGLSIRPPRVPNGFRNTSNPWARTNHPIGGSGSLFQPDVGIALELLFCMVPSEQDHQGCSQSNRTISRNDRWPKSRIRGLLPSDSPTTFARFGSLSTCQHGGSSGWGKATRMGIPRWAL